MKIALVLPGSIWYAPYVRIYTRILDEQKVDYSIISWNREGDDKAEGFQYNVRCENGHGSAGLNAYRGYIRFIKHTVRIQGYDKLIVFGPQMTCLLSQFLLLNYRHRFMIDYRDLSIEQKPGFKQLFSLMLRFSCVNVISSPGFKRVLPKGHTYYLSHNFDVDAVRRALYEGTADKPGDNPITVLTIGGIRDYSSNIEVVKALANKDGFRIQFVGKGGAAAQLKAYADEHHIHNIEFEGYYPKEKEAEYVKAATFLNIFYPRIITHDTALSNRFYNSLIFKRPMIVTKDTAQGDYVEKYGVGVAVKDCCQLNEKLAEFLLTDPEKYKQRCNELLRIFLKDQEGFERKMVDFIFNL